MVLDFSDKYGYATKQVLLLVTNIVSPWSNEEEN